MSSMMRRPYIPLDENEIRVQAGMALNEIFNTLIGFAETLSSKKDEIVQAFSTGSSPGEIIDVANSIKNIFEGASLCMDIDDVNDPFIEASSEFIDALMDPGEEWLHDLLMRKKFLQTLDIKFTKFTAELNKLILQTARQAVYSLSSLEKGRRTYPSQRSETQEAADALQRYIDRGERT